MVVKDVKKGLGTVSIPCDTCMMSAVCKYRDEFMHDAEDISKLLNSKPYRVHIFGCDHYIEMPVLNPEDSWIDEVVESMETEAADDEHIRSE